MTGSDEEEPTYIWGTTSQINDFIKHLNKSKRILALCGAGLSAPSGIPTFVDSGTYWKNHKAASLSSIDAFEANPGPVWSYFADRRRLALKAKPNRAHVALSGLATKKGGNGKGVKVLTQNIDGLSQRAGHPRERLYELHGSLMDIKCTNKECEYYDKDNFEEPICPALAADPEESSAFSSKPTTSEQSTAAELSIGLGKVDINIAHSKYERPPNALQAILDSLAPTITPAMLLSVIPTSQLPHCLKCSSLLRPAVIWFGESLSQPMFDEIDTWIEEEKKLDLMLVIGTRAEVYPAARFVQTARERGARIAVVNLDEDMGVLVGKKDVSHKPPPCLLIPEEPGNSCS